MVLTLRGLQSNPLATTMNSLRSRGCERRKVAAKVKTGILDENEGLFEAERKMEIIHASSERGEVGTSTSVLRLAVSNDRKLTSK